MKKPFLTLTMCLALTASSALSAEAPKTCPVAKPPVAAAKPAPAETLAKPDKPCKMMSKEEAKKMFEEKMIKERELMYNALNLTEEQRKKAEVLDSQTREGAKPLFKKVRAEKSKLNKMLAQKASSWEIWKQENAVKQAKKDMRAYFEKSKKSFEEILTKEQKAKFKILEEERKCRMDQFKNMQKHPCGKGKCPKGFGPEFMGPPPGPEFMGPPPEAQDQPPMVAPSSGHCPLYETPKNKNN